jgi:transcriptional/translational regulatory protein YebC/TACO1
VNYSGHNRWSKIRHKKGAVDAQRSAIFSRLTNVRQYPSNSSIYEKEDHLRGREDGFKKRRGSQKEKRLTSQEIHQSMKPPLSPDPNANPRLAAALQKAKEGGVPKSGVENALARVSCPFSTSL